MIDLNKLPPVKFLEWREPEARVCDRCGSLVADTADHDDWHTAIERAATEPRPVRASSSEHVLEIRTEHDDALAQALRNMRFTRDPDTGETYASTRQSAAPYGYAAGGWIPSPELVRLRALEKVLLDKGAPPNTDEMIEWLNRTMANLLDYRQFRMKARERGWSDRQAMEGIDRPLTDKEAAEIYVASGWGTPEEAAEWANGERREDPPCPSLYLSDGVLYQCALPVGEDWHNAKNGGGVKPDTTWTTPVAVPVPWPKDQIPPAGINVLHDTGDPDDDQPYLIRVMDEENSWFWSDTPTVHEPGQGSPLDTAPGSWQEYAANANGDLVVIKP